MDQLLTALRGAGEATRLRIIALLSKGELTVGELVQILNQSQPRVSRHLKLMGDSGLLDRFQEGTQVFYRLSEAGPAGQLNAVIVGLIDDDNDEFLTDLQQLVAIRRERAERAQAYFDANAKEWNRLRSLHVSEEQVEAALLSEQGGGHMRSLLDVGTGTGRMLQLFAPLADHAIGIDISRSMLAIARSHLDGEALNHCQVRLGDMYDLGVLDGSQDLILFHQVLHFAEEPAKALAEASRALSTQGVMLIADFAPHEHEFLRDQHAHRRLGFSEEEIAGWGEASGLSLASVTHLDGGELRVTIWKFCKRDTEL